MAFVNGETAFVHRPASWHPPEEIQVEEVVEDLMRVQGEGFTQKGLSRFAANTGVKKKYFVQSLREAGRRRTYEDLNDLAVEWVRRMTVTTARQALQNAGIRAEDVNVFITFHLTGQMVPGPADVTAPEIGLRSDVITIPTTELGCAGGAHALALAARLAPHHGPVLVAGAEVASTTYQLERDRRKDHKAFKIIFGDGAASAVVTPDRPEGDSFEIVDSWQELLPNSTHYYGSSVRSDGPGFDGSPDALGGVAQVVPRLPRLAQDDWKPEFGLLHPGSLQIVEETAAETRLPAGSYEWAKEVLAEVGAFGGPTILAVTERAFAAPPRPDAEGLLVAFGPGFRMEASRVIWRPSAVRASAYGAA